MLHRLNTLVRGLAVCASISACAPVAGVADSSKTSAGSGASSRMSDLPVAPATRRIYSADEWDGGGDRPSPDGRYLSKTDWSTGDLVLRDLTTNSTVRLTNKGSWDTSDDFAESSVISPDGKSIAYGWYSHSARARELRVMALVGPDSGKARAIYRASSLAFTGAQAWTPDGRNIVAGIQLDDKTTHIAIVPVFEGKAKRLKSFDWRYPNGISVSPNGKWLAYDFPPDEKSADRDIFLLALDGSGENVISEKGDEFVVGWTRDGSRLLYGSEKSGTQGIWAISLVNGKPAGSPVLVRSNMWRMAPLGTTLAGRVVYEVNRGLRDVFTLTLDPRTGEAVSRPTAMNGPANINPFALAWSPDGQHMAQVVLRGGPTGIYGPSDIVIRSIEQGERRRLSPQMSQILHVYWAPYGSSLVVRGADAKGQHGIFAVDLKTAKMRTIADSPVPGFGRWLTIAPDGKVAFFVNQGGAVRGTQIARLDMGTGAMQPVYRVDEPQRLEGIAISQDGASLWIGIRGGVYGRGIIASLPVAGGTPREVYRFSQSEAVSQATNFALSREGRELVFGVTQTTDPAGLKVDLRALSLSNGTLRSLNIPPVRISSLRVSPDGRRLAYSINDVSTELWSMDQPVFDSGKAVADRR